MKRISSGLEGCSPRWIRPVVTLAAVAWLATGCVSTFSEVKPLSKGAPPKERPSVLSLGEIRIADARVAEADRTVMVHAFQLGVEKWCAEHKAFDVRTDLSATNPPPDAIVLNGTILEVEKGSAAARFWVGMGTGQERVVGEFMLGDLAGARAERLSWTCQ